MLVDSAISIETAIRFGVRPGKDHRDRPGMVFPYTDEYRQVRLDDPPINPKTGKPQRYSSPPGVNQAIRILRDADEVADTAPVLLVEGCKQALAVWEATDALEGRPIVVMMAGCNGAANADLSVVENRDLIVLLDADVNDKWQVWTALDTIKGRSVVFGATSVKVPPRYGSGTCGMDDLLASAPDAEKRTRMMVQIIDKATDKLPSKPRGNPPRRVDVVESDDDDPRAVILTGGDLRDVRDQITTAMVDAFDARTLFNFGGAIATLKDGKTKALTDAEFLGEASNVCRFCKSAEGELVPTRPDSQAVRISYANVDAYSELRRVTRTPFFDEDRLVSRPGYDRATNTYLVEGVDVSVPDRPTKNQVTAAAKLLRDEWLGDFVFATEQDKTRAIGLLLTIILRDSTGLVPMFVLTAPTPGAGKGMLGNLISLVARGIPRGENHLPDSDEETRKAITSAVWEGKDVLSFDEVSTLEGKSLAMTITAETYEDRILGLSKSISIPNRVTLIALGNGIQVRGDMTRRVVPIRLEPDRPDYHQRDDFRHDEPGWTTDHRAELLSAAMTLIKAWLVAGRPPEVKDTTMGSFPKWDKMIGGILNHAGMPGHLDGVYDWANDGNYDRHEWDSHLRGLLDVFKGQTPRASEVINLIEVINPSGTIPPPPNFGKHLDDIAAGDEKTRKVRRRTAAQALGHIYNRRKDGWTSSGLRLVKAGEDTATKVALWKVEVKADTPSGTSGTLGDITQSQREKHTHFSSSSESCVSHTYKGAGDSPEVPEVPEHPDADRLLTWLWDQPSGKSLRYAAKHLGMTIEDAERHAQSLVDVGLALLSTDRGSSAVVIRATSRKAV